MKSAEKQREYSIKRAYWNAYRAGASPAVLAQINLGDIDLIERFQSAPMMSDGGYLPMKSVPYVPNPERSQSGGLGGSGPQAIPWMNYYNSPAFPA